jgi:ABC-2 type transport system permease protein
MNRRIVAALVQKDFTLFFRNRFFAVITFLGVVFYIVIYFLMPASVDEKLTLGLYAPDLPAGFEIAPGEGLVIERTATESALREAVLDGEYGAGIILPAGFVQVLATGGNAGATIYFTADAPQEFRDTISVLIREIGYALSGQTVPLEISEEVLGPDMAGMQIPPRDRMLPLFAVLVLITETLGLASLISEEIEGRTVEALLVTPTTARGLFLAKAITGVGLAFVQALMIVAITGGLNMQPLPILVALLLGSGLVTGIGFLIASTGKDMMSVMGWGLPIMIILLIPSFGVMFPGAISDWVRVIPSYYLVDTVHISANFGLGWAYIWQNLLILLGFDVVIGWLGIMVLGRKLR